MISHLSHQHTEPKGDELSPYQCCSLPHLSITPINRNTSSPLHQHHGPLKDTRAALRHKQILLGYFPIVVNERQRKPTADGGIHQQQQQFKTGTTRQQHGVVFGYLGSTERALKLTKFFKKYINQNLELGDHTALVGCFLSLPILFTTLRVSKLDHLLQQK